PDWVPRPEAEQRTSESFFVLNRSLSPSTRVLLGALCFALLVLLWVPWSLARTWRTTLRWLSLAPMLLWLWFTASVFFEVEAQTNGVIVAEATLRTADSNGAASALEQPLPAGVEVVVRQRRDGWAQV